MGRPSFPARVVLTGLPFPLIGSLRLAMFFPLSVPFSGSNPLIGKKEQSAYVPKNSREFNQLKRFLLCITVFSCRAILPFSTFFRSREVSISPPYIRWRGPPQPLPFLQLLLSFPDTFSFPLSDSLVFILIFRDLTFIRTLEFLETLQLRFPSEIERPHTLYFTLSSSCGSGNSTLPITIY